MQKHPYYELHPQKLDRKNLTFGGQYIIVVFLYTLKIK